MNSDDNKKTIHCDWLTATTLHDVKRVVRVLKDYFGYSVEITRALARNRGFLHAILISDAEGEICSLEYGQRDKYTLICSTGSQRPTDVIKALRALDEIRVTRLDIAIDLEHADWEALVCSAKNYASQYFSGRQTTTTREIRSSSGNTMYFGAASSVNQVRIYEKGKEQLSKGNSSGDFALDAVRVELQIRPDNELTKQKALYLPLETLLQTSPKWFTDFLNNEIGSDLEHVSRVRELTTWERKYAWLIKQAGPTFRKAVDTYGLAKVLEDLEALETVEL